MAMAAHGGCIPRAFTSRVSDRHFRSRTLVQHPQPICFGCDPDRIRKFKMIDGWISGRLRPRMSTE